MASAKKLWGAKPLPNLSEGEVSVFQMGELLPDQTTCYLWLGCLKGLVIYSFKSLRMDGENISNRMRPASQSEQRC